jgi:zinc/manganese transport system permease protein
MSWLTEALSHPFLRDALLAGSAVAVMAGLVGWFVVLRAQVFTGDALSHVAFTGTLAALALGLDPHLGLFAATIGVGLAMGALGRRGRADDVVIGTIFAWVLGLGVLFLSIYTSSRSTGNGAAGVATLFGSIFGIGHRTALLTTGIALVIVVVMLAIARPLLFASIDEAVAAARGVPVRVLGIGFLGLVGASAAEASQVVGALLLLGLLAAPAGTAHRLTDRPYLGMGLSVGVALLSLWAGLVISYRVPTMPPSFSILTVAALCYLAAAVATTLTRREGQPRPTRRRRRAP